MSRTILCLAGGGALLGLVGCGGAAPPHEAQTETQAAIRSAQEVGAEQEPRASYYLELARENVSRAEQHIELGNMTMAERALERADADAELAIALAREANARDQASLLRDNIEDMRGRLL